MYEEIQSTNSDDMVTAFVESIKQQSLDMCKELFYGGSEAFDFLGTNRGTGEAGKFYRWANNSNQSFWNNSIGTHCVIAALDCMRKNYFEKTVSRYSLSSYALNKGENEILQKYINKETGQWLESVRTGNSGDNAGKGCALKSAFDTKNKKKQIVGEECKRIFDNNIDAIPTKNIMGIAFIFNNLKEIKRLSEGIANDKKIVSVESYAKDVDILVNAIKESREMNLTETDKILLAYRLEKYFGYVLATQIVELSAELQQDLQQDLQGTIPTELFAEILNLPNVFSRKLFLRYILEGALSESLESNFFSRRKEDYSSNPLYKSKESNAGELDRWMKWQELVKEFNYFMSRFLFPIAENSFLILFLNSVEQCSNQSEEKALLWDAMKILDRYLELNGAELMKEPYKKYCKDKWLPRDANQSSLREEDFDIWNIDLPAYKKAEKAKKKEYDIFLKRLLQIYYQKYDEMKRPCFDETFFSCRAKANEKLYKKLGAIYMEMLGV